MFGTLLVLAFVTPLRYAISLPMTSYRMARMLGASSFVAGFAAAWSLSLMTASGVFLFAEREMLAALAFAGWALPLALLWLLRSLVPRTDPTTPDSRCS